MKRSNIKFSCTSFLASWRPISLLLLLLCGVASARCREPVEPPLSKEARLANAKNVYFGYISAVSIDETDETLRKLAENKLLFRCRSPAATLRFVVVNTIKGEIAEVKSISWRFSFAGPGRLGTTITAYENAQGWWLDDGKERTAEQPFTKEELDQLPRASPAR